MRWLGTIEQVTGRYQSHWQHTPVEDASRQQLGVCMAYTGPSQICLLEEVYVELVCFVVPLVSAAYDADLNFVLVKPALPSGVLNVMLRSKKETFPIYDSPGVRNPW